MRKAAEAAGAPRRCGAGGVGEDAVEVWMGGGTRRRPLPTRAGAPEGKGYYRYFNPNGEDGTFCGYPRDSLAK
ncbi:hypothetical protein EJB05_14151, partial [Eragrostis curvula]